MDTAVLKTSDSLKAGTKSDTALALIGKNSLLAGFSFVIPILPEFRKLRSDDENSVLYSHMDKDVETHFDENDVHFPVGLSYARIISPLLQLHTSFFFSRGSNENRWTPRKGDTLYVTNYVNRYQLTLLELQFQAQFNLMRHLLIVDRFQRVYIAVQGGLFPYAGLITERTELAKKISARGMGTCWGMAAGIERYLSSRSSFSGELAYSLATLEGFKDHGTVRASDLFKNGGSEALSLSMSALSFRFQYGRWF